MSTTWQPSLVPDAAGKLRDWLERELRAIKEAWEAEKPSERLQIRHAEPQRLREGMLVYADGSDWDPGSGEGVYRYSTGGTWEFLGLAAGDYLTPGGANDIGTATGVSLDVTGNVSSSGGLIGYTAGAGGAVTQATSKATGVTLDSPCGQITMNNAALAANTTVSFTLTSTKVSASDAVTCHRKSGGTDLAYQVWVDSVSNGSCVICVRNITGGSLSEAVVLTFSVFNGVTA